jgi:phage terminase small subunit
MPVLKNQRHEVFCRAVCSNCAPAEAYERAGFSGKGTHASASRLLRNAQICARIAELQQQSAKVFVVGQIRERTYRVAVLEDVLRRMVGLMDARAIDLADVPGGSTGLLVRQLKSFEGNIVPSLSVEL